MNLYNYYRIWEKGTAQPRVGQAMVSPPYKQEVIRLQESKEERKRKKKEKEERQERKKEEMVEAKRVFDNEKKEWGIKVKVSYIIP